MKILVIGSGAREHALVQALERSPKKPQLYVIGTSLNPGIQTLTKDYEIGDILDAAALVDKAQSWGIELVIIGPEAPLEAGVADRLWQAQIPVIGPKKALAQLETSKAFARDLMKQFNIPGLPAYREFKTLAPIADYLKERGHGHYVIKANGLMAGKGVKVAGEHLHSFSEALAFCEAILSTQASLIIEEKLIGQEFSMLCFADGNSLIPMPLVQDHKRAWKGDKGPNTGGMGSYSDANHSLPFLSDTDVKDAFAINQAVFQALMKTCGQPYIGFLYGSFIATKKGIFVIEFNARLGDPEALNVLPVLETDFVSICLAMVQGELEGLEIKFAKAATVCKYAVPEGYPDAPAKNFKIDCSEVDDPAHLYLGAVDFGPEGLMATGSRTAAFVGIAATLAEAEKKAEAGISHVQGALYHRDDIGTEALIQQRIDDMLRIRSS